MAWLTTQPRVGTFGGIRSLDLEFAGELWYWRGPSPYHFITVPRTACVELRAGAAVVSYGWGMIPVKGPDRRAPTGDLAVSQGRRATSSPSRTRSAWPKDSPWATPWLSSWSSVTDLSPVPTFSRRRRWWPHLCRLHPFRRAPLDAGPSMLAAPLNSLHGASAPVAPPVSHAVAGTAGGVDARSPTWSSGPCRANDETGPPWDGKDQT